MKREKFDELIGLYLSKEVSDDDKKKIREDLLGEGFSPDELDELVKMDEQLADLPKGKSSPDMSSRFYSWLEKEKRHQKGNSGFLFLLKYLQGPTGRIAAGIALFITGWLGSNLINQPANELGVLNKEVTQLKQSLVLTKMQQESSIDRIQAVNMVNELNEVDDAVIQSLLTVLISDQNDNVRLAALESILPYADSPTVREGLIRSISKQSSPLVQLRLAEIMRVLQDPGAIPEIRKVLESKNLNYNVKTKYTEALNLLI